MSAVTVAEVVAALRQEMLVDCRKVEFDLKVDDETGAIELATDDWTLQIDGMPDAPDAWVAIDAEPDYPGEYEKAAHDAFRAVELAALRRANQGLNGLLAEALHTSLDPFSQHLSEILTRP